MGRRWPIVVSVDPVSGDELDEQGPIEATLTAIVHIFRRRLMAQLGKAQASAELAIVAPAP